MLQNPFYSNNVLFDEFGRPWVESRAIDGSIFYFDPCTGLTRIDKPGALNLDLMANFSNQNSEIVSIQQEVTNSLLNDKSINQEQEYLTNKTDKKPVDAQPIHGTNWYLVQTKDEKFFYFNNLTKNSKWEKPEELINNVLVDVMIQSINCKLAEKRKLEEARINQFLKKPKIEDALSNLVHVERENYLECTSKAPIEERIQIFKNMLSDIGVSAFTTWDNELPKIINDHRFTVLSSKDRRAIFNEYLKERVTLESESRINQQKNLKETFKSFLKEVITDNRLNFSVFRMKFAEDERFNVNLKLKDKETLFDEYINELRLIEYKTKVPKDELEFLSLLKELKDFTNKTEWYDVKPLIRNDERYDIVSSSKRHEIFENFKKCLENSNEEVNKNLDKEQREKASIEERRKQVDKERKALCLQTEKERTIQDHEKAINLFNCLLVDLIRDLNLKWKKCKKIIKADSRYKSCKFLSKKEKRQIFKDHSEHLLRKKRRLFHLWLEELNLELTSKWIYVLKKIDTDVRYSRFNDNSLDLEREFDFFIDTKLAEAKADLRELLKETKLITHKTAEKIKSNPSFQNEIVEILKKDKRYLDLEFLGEKREQIVARYIEELERRGSPPPPTAYPRSIR